MFQVRPFSYLVLSACFCAIALLPGCRASLGNGGVEDDEEDDGVPAAGASGAAGHRPSGGAGGAGGGGDLRDGSVAVDAAPPREAGLGSLAGADGARPEPPSTPSMPLVAISEIMYHPVLENDAQDNHEFIELHNPSGTEASLKDWKLILGKKEAFTFAANASIAPGKFLVVAKNRQKLIALHGLRPEEVLGDYQGELDNGGETVVLVNEKDDVIDAVRYDDKMPWPIGADALGMGRAWWPAGEYEKQRYKGRSLERYSYSVPASDVRNWEASPLGGGTPGRANSVSGEPPAIVLEVSAAGADGVLVKRGEKITVKARLSAGTVSDLAVEYFVDDLAKADGTEPKSMVPMTLAADLYTAEIPAQPERSIVRYRIVGRRGGSTVEPISPRASDPNPFHAAFVQPNPVPPPRSYQVFITPGNWTRMWTNLGSGPNSGCTVNPNWDARQPAVVVYEGRVYDVQVRYQGSRYQRRNGYRLPSYPAGTGPSQPSDLRAQSWRLSFPKYNRWQGGKGDRRRVVTLNKHYQSCPGVLNLLEYVGLLDSAIRAA
jgi:hypothetical protein